MPQWCLSPLRVGLSPLHNWVHPGLMVKVEEEEVADMFRLDRVFGLIIEGQGGTGGLKWHSLHLLYSMFPYLSITKWQLNLHLFVFNLHLSIHFSANFPSTF